MPPSRRQRYRGSHGGARSHVIVATVVRGWEGRGSDTRSDTLDLAEPLARRRERQQREPEDRRGAVLTNPPVTAVPLTDHEAHAAAADGAPHGSQDRKAAGAPRGLGALALRSRLAAGPDGRSW